MKKYYYDIAVLKTQHGIDVRIIKGVDDPARRSGSKIVGSIYGNRSELVNELQIQIAMVIRDLEMENL